jgi:protein involved in polysaccharide export with SLBB domain
LLFLLALGVGVGFGGPHMARAQSAGSSMFDVAGANPLTLLRQRLAQSGISTTSLPLEGTVDGATYVVGPGDGFSLTVNGSSMTPTPAEVSADGMLMLPDAGAVRVGGLTLDEAKRASMTVLERSYRNADITLSLVQSRQFYVHVSGAVPAPGRYLALPVARVSSVLELAFADTLAQPVTNRSFRPSLRNVRLLHADGTESGADLIQYFSSGDRSANPYLRDGDVIFIPAYQPASSSIFVDGAVPFPGDYDYRPGDTVRDLIRLAGGVDAGAARAVRLIRQDGTTVDMTIDEALGARGAGTPVQARDHVQVVIPAELRGQANVTGQVTFPGTYPIVEGETTLRELVATAGGIRDEALLRGAYLERRVLPDPLETLRVNRFGPQPPLEELISLADTTAIMQRLRLSDMDFMSRAYFAQEMRLQNRVSVNLEDALQEGARDVYIRNGDRLVIPRNPNAVFVFGQVNQPGFVDFQPGLTAEEYVNVAGGRSAVAQDVYIIHPASGQILPAGSRALESGDFLFVDRKVDIADSPELQRLLIEENRTRADARIRTLQTVVQSVGTLASVVALIISIRRN